MGFIMLIGLHLDINMRKIARADENQYEIAKVVRQMGGTVEFLHQLGNGIPDLLIGFRGHNLIWEIKDGTKPRSQRKLTPDQEEWHANWKGNKQIIKSMEDAHDFLAKLKFAEKFVWEPTG